MPPIPIYTDSPVAAKPSGVTPQTAAPGTEKHPAPATVTATPTQQTGTSAYPAARPGAAPSLPTPTATAAAPSARTAAYLPPTPTQSLAQRSDAPPPPQPGAAPAPTTRTTGAAHLPPPPKDGEKYVPAQAAAAPVPSYPQQMGIPPPTMAYPAQQSGTMSAAGAGPTPTMFYGGQSSSISSSGASGSLQHPPGYHQNVNASELDRYQQSAASRNDSDLLPQQKSGWEADDDEEGVWSSAKRWAQATGEKLVAAETEVWKRINKE